MLKIDESKNLNIEEWKTMKIEKSKSQRKFVKSKNIKI